MALVVKDHHNHSKNSLVTHNKTLEKLKSIFDTLGSDQDLN